MCRVTVVSGKNGGLQAMLPMLECFIASERWRTQLLLWDQHGRAEFGPTCDLPQGLLRLSRPVSALPREQALLKSALGDDAAFSAADLVIVYGDRLDALLAATMAHSYGTPVAHLQAGDISGGIDHAIRYAVTALSTFAFCATSEQVLALCHFKNSAGLGFTTYRVGDHHIDALRRIPLRTGRTGKWMVHLHPDTLATPAENERLAQMVFDAVGYMADYVMPCTDRMHESVMAVWLRNGVKTLPYLSQEEYIGRLSESEGLIGNSSAAVIDAPALGIRAILVGNRQAGRGGAAAVHTLEKLQERMASTPARTEPSTAYGDGTAGKQTFDILDSHFA